MRDVLRTRPWSPSLLPVLVVTALVCLGAANVASRAVWSEQEDGVLWTQTDDGVVAAEIAGGTPAAATQLRPGDLLLAMGDRPVQRLSDVVDALHAATDRASLPYTVIRLGSQDVIDIQLAPVPGGAGVLYFVLAAVGTFSLLVGGAVRLRRPRDQATLHFLWLAVAFFGVFTFSFSGRLDRLDWVFFWADAISILALPPLFLHFTLVFPDRPHRAIDGRAGRWLLFAIYAPAFVLGLTRVGAIARGGASPDLFVSLTAMLDRIELLYLAGCFLGGLVALMHALSSTSSLTARRQLRWIVLGTGFGVTPFALGYALPYAAGTEPSLPMELSVVPLSLIPLAFASAIVRYRLMDIEIIVKRVLAYSVALMAIVSVYAVLLQIIQRVFLDGSMPNHWVLAVFATFAAIILAPPVKDVVQHALDRAFYRDRYDYRRALVGFARDLNSDLDLNRLAERLVSRVVETLLVDRMVLMIEDENAKVFGSVRSSGFGHLDPPVLGRSSGIGSRLDAGHIVALDDPMVVGRLPAEDIEFWRDAGLYYFVPCLSKEGTIAVLALGRKDTGEPLNSEDMELLAAVAGQIATALESARLYRQLHVKADELDRLRAFNENILESLDDGLMVIDATECIVRWNTAIEQLYGVEQSEAVGRDMAELFDTPFVQAVRAARRDAPSGSVLSRMPLMTRASKARQALTVNVSVVPLRAAEEAGVATGGTIVIVEDVTARVRLEEQLQISEKMASIGVLAAGVAHEVNTPLTGISSFTQILLENADPADPRTQLLEKIERQTFRAARIVNGLLTLSRPATTSSSDRAPVDVNAVITDVLGLLEHQLEACRIKARRELTDDSVVVLGMEHKLQQVFLNLFLNAKDAMPKGGWVSIATRTDGDRIVVDLSDTGSGIPGEYIARIYDPFFTTKAIGQGTGLGLSITYGIVREHDGTIDCSSVSGQGTRFTLSFPAAAAGSSARAAQH